MATLSQQMAVAIAPKFTAFASAVCSTITICLIARVGKKNTYHRLMLGMSACDFLASAAWFFTTWPIPRGTPGVYGAVGTQQTCSAQAFFAQFSISAVMYNASLAAYYALVIVKGWNDAHIARVEPIFHINAFAWGLGTGFAALGLGLFNPVGWDCWLGASPLGCQESWNAPEGMESTCERGDNASLYQWAFYYGPLWFVIILVTCLMSWIYCNVRSLEVRMAKYSVKNTVSIAQSAHEGQRLAKSKRIAVQAAFYVGAFFAAWMFPTIYQLVIVITNTFPFPLLFLTAFFVPSQGVLNLIVYIRPKYNTYRRQNSEEFIFAAWFRVLRQELTKYSSQIAENATASTAQC